MEDNLKQLNDKELKKEMRRMKREAKYERRYGNPVMMKIAENDLNVRPYYERYKDVKRSQMWSLAMVGLFMLLGVVDILLVLFTQKESWVITLAVDLLISLYWVNDIKISEREADLLCHEFVQYADGEVIRRVANRMGGKEN
jgi:hypothetical protein